MKIAIHSTTDKITNSSTVIYTYSEDSEPAFEALVNEMFDCFGVKERCSDVFKVKVVQEDLDTSPEYCGTNLVVTTKNKKYKKLAKLLLEFLYSTNAEEGAE